MVASTLYSGLGPLSKYEREGIPQRPDLKGDSSTVHPDKSSLRLRKASGRDATVGSSMTSVLPSWRSWSCCTRMETFTLQKKDTSVTFWAERKKLCHTYDTSVTIIVTKPGIIIDVVGCYFYAKKS